MEIFSVMFFIHTSKVIFYWARGAGARGEPKEARGKFASSHSPFPFRFSHSRMFRKAKLRSFASQNMRSPFLIPFPLRA